MLGSVRRAVCLASFLGLALALTVFGKTGAEFPSAKRNFVGRQVSSAPDVSVQASGQSAAQPQQKPSAPVPSGQPPKTAPGTASSAPATPTASVETIVLDPAHGGTDEGAHGSGGIMEKDVTLVLAREIAPRLERDGLNVVMTRQSDQNLSFEQRAAIANAQTNAVFLTLHVGSSGTVGSACAYYYDFGQLAHSSTPPATGGLLNWEYVQLPWQRWSRRLAELLQSEISGRLPHSPELPVGAAVYQLREINEPAVAIELENVNASNAATLEAAGRPLATSIWRALQAFRTMFPAGAH
jgi:N-acetylmuramoyl-L-alanine amidase